MNGQYEGTSNQGSLLLLRFFDEVYVPQRMIGCTDRAIYQYRLTIEKFSRHLRHDAQVTDLTDATVAGFLRAYSRGRSPATTNTALTHLRAIANYAARQRLCDWLSIKKLKEYRRIPKAWTPEEMTKIIQACENEWHNVGGILGAIWWKALVLVLYNTGCRIGAILATPLANLNSQRKMLTVPAEVQKQRADQVFCLDDRTLAAIHAMGGQSRDLLFPWHRKRRMFYLRLDEIIQRAGLPHGAKDKCHKIRRTTATMVELTGGRGTATALLGHSSPEVTRRYIDESQLPSLNVTEHLPRVDLGNPAELIGGLDLLESVEEYHTAVAAYLAPGRYLADLISQLRKIVKGCGFARIADFDINAAETYIECVKGRTPRTGREYHSALQGFLRWLAATKGNTPNLQKAAAFINGNGNGNGKQ